jgi:hypothetical protein
MNPSFRSLKLVSPDLLEQRLELVRELEGREFDFYHMMKDKATGEHYLHYSYDHVDVSAGMAKQTYHHLMPLEADDVIAVMIGEQGYHYPEAWGRMYLRNGPDGDYVWFDGQELTEQTPDEEIGHEVQQMLIDFKRGGQFDERSIQELFARIDELNKKDEA